MAKQYISNKDESIPLFENQFLDKFSYVHPSTPVVLFLPVVFYFAYRAAVSPVLNLQAIGLLFLLGVLAWTLTEYAIHRFVFHLKPRSKLGQYLLFLMHGVHHDYPNDSRRLVMAPAVSLPLAVLFYWLFRGLFGESLLLAFFPGFVFGYICYDMIHFATHHYRLRSKVGQLLRQNHLKHHYQNGDLGFGVSSPLWDKVFGTLVAKD